MSEDLESLNSIITMADLARALKHRRIRSGFATLPALLKNVKRDHPLPRSTAYNLEAGTVKCNWASVEAHLRACGASNSEIEAWKEAHSRALSGFADQGTPTSEKTTTPTAKQLAEMGPEQAGRILSEIDPTEAADLLRRIKLKHAAELLPEISLNVVVALIGKIGRARASLLFENVEAERGAELLAEMDADEALELLHELDAPRAAELIAVMPRGRAAKLLQSLEVEQVISLLTEMPPPQAAMLLGTLGADLAIRLTNGTQIRKAARILNSMDAEIVAQIIAEKMSDQKALELLAEMEVVNVGACLRCMDGELAQKLMLRLPADRLGEVFSSSFTYQQIETLSSLMEVDEAAAVLVRIYSEDLRYVLREIPAKRLAAIVMGMNPHDRVLTLALMRGLRNPVLAELPSDESGIIEQEMVLPNLAGHLASIDPERAAAYLDQLDELNADLLSHMEPACAARIVISLGHFDAMADMLNFVAPKQTAWILQTMDTWESALIIDSMLTDQAVLVLYEIDQPLAERILRQVEKNVDRRSYKENDLSSKEFDKVRSQRRSRVNELREKLSQRSSR